MNTKDLLVNYLVDCIRYQDLNQLDENVLILTDLDRLSALIIDNPTWEDQPSEIFPETSTLADDISREISTIQNNIELEEYDDVKDRLIDLCDLLYTYNDERR